MKIQIPITAQASSGLIMTCFRSCPGPIFYFTQNRCLIAKVHVSSVQAHGKGLQLTYVTAELYSAVLLYTNTSAQGIYLYEISSRSIQCARTKQ